MRLLEVWGAGDAARSEFFFSDRTTILDQWSLRARKRQVTVEILDQSSSPLRQCRALKLSSGADEPLLQLRFLFAPLGSEPIGASQSMHVWMVQGNSLRVRDTLTFAGVESMIVCRC